MKLTGIISRHPLRSLAAVILLYLVIHLPFISLPPCSIHVWRQCNTLAVTRNFFKEDSNIFQPRVDRRGLSNGVTGMQFPLYEWILSKVYLLSGEHYTTQRSYSLVLASLSIVAMFFFLKSIARDNFFAFAGAWCLAWSPEFFYHGMNAIPDIMAFAAALAACYTFVKWTEREGRKYYLFTFFFLLIAGLVKIQYYMIVAFMAGTLLIQQHTLRNLLKKKVAAFFLMAMLTATLILSWYMYARHLIFISGLRDFGIEMRPVYNAGEAFNILKRNLISDFPELMLNYAGFILLIPACFLLQKTKFSRWPALAGLMLLVPAYAAYHLLELQQMRVHQYYMLPALIFLIPLAAAGAVYLFRNERLRALGILLLVAAPVLCAIRIIPARWQREDLGIPGEFANPAQLSALQKAVPDNALIVTGPDPSGCIFFYFLGKKGYSFEKDFTENSAGAYKGADYLYLYKAGMQQGWREIKQVGNWKVFERLDRE